MTRQMVSRAGGGRKRVKECKFKMVSGGGWQGCDDLGNKCWEVKGRTEARGDIFVDYICFL